jgi:hypothetical protein
MSIKKEETQTTRIAGMSRREILEALQTTTRYSPEMESWTRPELAEILKEARGPRSTGTEIDREVTRVSRLRKAQIQEVLLENGLEVSETETIGLMLSRYRSHLGTAMPAEADEIVSFGQHKGITFAEIQVKYPDYCVWVRDQYHQKPGNTCLGLHRLACWLEGIHPGSQTPNPGESSSSGRPSLAARPKATAKQAVKQETEDSPPERPKPKRTAVKSAARPGSHRSGEHWMTVEPQHFNLSTEDESTL